MGIEIERKFLVRPGWRPDTAGAEIRQGYIADVAGRTVRVRISGDEAWVTVKGPADGATRAEWEWPVPVGDAADMLGTVCDNVVEKRRHRVTSGGRLWEVDVFSGANAGLVVAEVELPSADAEVELPRWVEAEVTGDHRYANASLAARPYCTW